MKEFYNIESQAAIARLLSSKNGLNEEESKKRLIEYGYNVLEDRHKVNPFKIFLEQFKGFLIYILFGAVVISFILGEYIDGIAILVILVLNGVLGFLQEYRAEKSIDALKKLSTNTVTVIRNGKKSQIDSKFVVPGDIIFINSGDKISCDARVIETFLFQVDESSLTGESVAAKKKTEVIIGEQSLADRKNMVYSGTLCVSGNAIALCTSTGMNTELGKIADNITEQEEMLTPLQKDLDKLGKFIGYFVLLICLIILVVGLFDDTLAITAFTNGNYMIFFTELKDLFLTSVALAVAAVPEGMAIVVTIALAIGVKVMVKKHALIRKLPAIETLGCTTVICSDKTGTLTYNQMTVKRVYANMDDIHVSGDGYKAHGEFLKEGKQVSHSKIELLLECGCLNNDAELQDEHVVGDPTEGALIVSYEKLGLHKHQLETEHKRIREIPFDSTRKMMSTLHSNKSGLIMFSKGAPESILKLCDKIHINGKTRKLTSADKRKILSQNSIYAKDALRVLGFAYKPLKNEKQFTEDKLVFLGLQGMIDPPRTEVRDSIQKCYTAGIRVMMITGDHALTAEAIGRAIGIEGKTISGAEIDKINLEKEINDYSIFARVSPEHKMKIVEILQNKGEVVAMTGDGVNDAPALKHADIGIAMGITGTDVAKEASKMILLDDNFTSIVNAVEEGRGIYGNIKKFVNYMFSSNFGEVMIIFIALLIGFKENGNIILPFTALQILWLNLVTDSLPALALAVDPTGAKVMERKPRKKDAKIIDRQMLANIIYVGIIMTIAILGIFKWGIDNYDVLTAQTMALTLVVMLEVARVQVIRTQHHLSLMSNKWLVLALGSTIFLQIGIIYIVPIFGFLGVTITNPFKLIPLDISVWAIMLAITGLVYLISVGFSKTLDRIIPDD